MKRTMVMILMITLIAGLSAVAYAGPGNRGMGGGQGRGHGHGAGHMGGHPLLTVPWDRIVDIADEVGLTDDQLDALSTLRKDFREVNGALQNDLRNNRAELRELMVTAETDDRTRALELVDNINKIQGQVFKNSVTASFEIRKIVSEEQMQTLRTIAEERRDERREKRMDRRGRGGQRGRRGQRQRDF